MYRLSRSRGDHEPDREAKLSFRSVALLFPPKDVLERVRTSNSDSAVTSNKPIESLYDLDDSKTYPLSAHDHVRVIIAQDDTGVSIERLLYDSKWTQKSRSDKNINKKNEAGLFSLRPATSGPQSPTASGFLRPQTSHKPRPATSTTPERRLQSPPATSAFVPSTQLRRAPVSVSLADTRNDPLIPIEDTSEEMDSWLDCMFGKAPMRYKGAVTKIHHLQRQPPDPLATPLQSTPQRNEFPFYSERPTSLPRSKSKELVRLRKDALLISTTFAVNLHDEDLPEQLQHSNRRKRLSTPMFGVAILLPLAKPSGHTSTDQSVPELSSNDGDPVQSVIDNWHMYARALNALKATASIHIRQNLIAKAEAQMRLRTTRAPAIPRQIKLDPRAFEHAATIIHASSDAMDRVTSGSRVLKVDPQGEWNIWRDELRDFAKVESDPKRGSLNPSKVTFIQSCLTSVLSVELGWLHIFAPPQHQTRLREERQHAQSTLDLAQNRIVVVTKDQNKARNLVFIFAKLFPQSQPSVPFASSGRSSHGGTAPSAKGVSAITQGLEAEKYASNGSQSNGQANDLPNGQNRPAPTIFEPLSQCGSVMSPVKGTFNESDSTRKPGIAKGTGRIDIPGKATPAVPLSATNSCGNTPSGSPEARPGSSASAHGDLMRHLQRSSSTTTSNGSADTTSLWNSLRSSTWSLKPRRESTNTERSDSTSSQREQQPSGILKTNKSSVTRNGSSKLVRMVEECTLNQEDRRKDSAQTRDPTSETMNGSHYKTSALQFNPPTHDVSDISYTYNQDEGVVDVEFPGCMASPNSTRSLTGRAIGCKVPSSNNRFPAFGTARKTPERPRSDRDVLSGSPAKYDRVAGYLERFLPDFALQAVKPYSELVGEIKRAMRAEPSPKIEPSGSLKIFSQEAWIDVCSTVIIDAETLVVKRLTLRRHVRYKLITPDESPSLSRHGGSIDLKDHVNPPHTNGRTPESTNMIKVTKSEEMDSIRRTYKRNDHGQKVGFRDQRVQNSLSMNGSAGGDETYHSLPDQLKFFENGLSLSPDTLRSGASATPPNGQGREFTAELSATHTDAKDKRANSIAVGDDLSAFIDRKPGGSHKATSAGTATRRVTIKNKEGKITGWKEVQEGGSDEAGLNDLPTSFVEKRSDQTSPVIDCQILGESFEDEIISKPDSAVVSLLQQMVATGETRSRAHSRAGSIHSRAPSRSNSISSSGLTELQYESKKIIENTLEGLVSAVASDRYCSSSTPAGGLFGFGRNAPSSETSILRQSISKWMHSDA